MKKVLVTYFSASAGRVTAGVGDKLAELTGADVYEIKPAVPYTEKDIKWTNPLARCNREKVAGKYPELADHAAKIHGYDVIYIGFPIWYAVAPNVVTKFVKSYDFSGKIIIPFATSGGSGMGKSAQKLAAFVADSCKVIDGGLIQTAEDIEKLARLVK